MLRLPVVVSHDMSAAAGSPLAGWTSLEAMMGEADSEVVLVVKVC